MKTYSDVLEDLTSESYVIMTVLDFSPAFVSTDHNIIIRWLKLNIVWKELLYIGLSHT